MNKEERLKLENELLMTCSKAQAINKYIDELEENMVLTNQWYKSQQENKQLKESYERIYNENCKLREEHNITDISLLDENYKLKDNWNKLKEIIKKKQDYYRHFKDNRYRKFLSELLDKMQEIERTYR